MELAKLGQYLQENRHLPNLEKNTYTGQYEVGSMDMALLQKLEELSIYVVELNQQNIQLKQEKNKEISILKQENEQIKQAICKTNPKEEFCNKITAKEQFNSM